jgi:hypothetical protein
VLAAAVSARNADRAAVGVRDDDGVHAIELARAADILD